MATKLLTIINVKETVKVFKKIFDRYCTNNIY